MLLKYVESFYCIWIGGIKGKIVLFRVYGYWVIGLLFIIGSLEIVFFLRDISVFFYVVFRIRVRRFVVEVV